LRKEKESGNLRGSVFQMWKMEGVKLFNIHPFFSKIHQESKIYARHFARC
jgi:hypothetical protein